MTSPLQGICSLCTRFPGRCPGLSYYVPLGRINHRSSIGSRVTKIQCLWRSASLPPDFAEGAWPNRSPPFPPIQWWISIRRSVFADRDFMNDINQLREIHLRIFFSGRVFFCDIMPSIIIPDWITGVPFHTPLPVRRPLERRREYQQ